MQVKISNFDEIVEAIKNELERKKKFDIDKFLSNPKNLYTLRDKQEIQILRDGHECFEILIDCFKNHDLDIQEAWLDTAIHFFQNYYEINKINRSENFQKILNNILEKLNECKK